jgi:hypothetical protein
MTEVTDRASSVSLEMSARKEGAVVVVGQWWLQPHPPPKKTNKWKTEPKKKSLQTLPSKENEWSYGIRLFGMNILMEGALWQNAWKLE